MAAGLTLGVCLVVTVQTPVRGQVLIAGQTALENASAGALAFRAPGNMVSAGVARALAAADFARTPVEITETIRPVSPRAVFLVDAIEIVFDQVNRALLLLENVLRLRGGFPPALPGTILSPTTSGAGEDNATTDAATTALDISDLAGLLDRPGR
jgi:hypothetical protein